VNIVRKIGFALLVAVVVSVSLLSLANAVTTWQTLSAQRALASFYEPLEPTSGNPGTLIRHEPIDVEVEGGSAHRILYVSERPDGSAGVSGGMVFIPDTPAPAEGRPVVAWAHGTVGMGDACAPSRSKNPLADTTGWLEQMMGLGWVVTATDYTGLGTPGVELYLVAEAEVTDVVNSVRAAGQVPDARTGTRYVVWGHSQGGHSALWSGHLAPDYAPELQLLGVAAAAPAAELTEIIGAQWQTAVAWAIGPEAVIAWREVDPSLPLDGILTTRAQGDYVDFAQECIVSAALNAITRVSLGEQFFETNPLLSAPWAQVLETQTPPALPPDMPTFIAQGTADTVVLAWPNALLLDRWCDFGSAIAMLWMGEVNHPDAAINAGPSAVSWIADRFADRPAPRTCEQPVPVSIPER